MQKEIASESAKESGAREKATQNKVREREERGKER